MKAVSLCAAINPQGLGNQDTKSPDADFYLLLTHAEPPLGVGNSDVALLTKPQQAKAQHLLAIIHAV